jgi:N-acetylneuraminic acid mutarotase
LQLRFDLNTMRAMLALALLSVAFSPSPTAFGDLEMRSTTASVAGRLPVAPSSFGAAEHDGWIYVLGGHLGHAHDYSREDQSRLLLRAHPWELSSWELAAVDERGIQGAVLVRTAAGLVRVGGMRALNAEDAPMELESVADVASFDAATGAWTALPALPTPRSSHQATFCDGKLFVVGGWTLASGDLDSGGAFAQRALVLDPAKLDTSWREIDAPGSRRGLALATLDSRVVVLGGMDEKGEPVSRVDVLDAATETWSSAPPFPEFGFGVAAAALGESVYASGRSGRIWRWRQGASAWDEVGTLVYPRIFHQMLALPDTRELVVIGGNGSGQRIAPVERIQLGSAGVGARVSRLTIHAPCATKNRQALVQAGDRLEFYGGNTGLDQHGFAPERFSAESWSLGLGDLEWRRLADLPVHRQSMATAVVGKDTALVLGGFGHDGVKTRSYAEGFRYDRALDAWSSAPALPGPRTQFGLVESAERLWLVGGLDYDAARGEDAAFGYPKAILAASKEDPRFEPVGVELPRSRRAFGCTELDGRIYLIGGLAEEFGRVETCDVLVTGEKRWETIPPPRKPRVSPELVALDGRLYLAGGSSPGADDELAPDRSVEVYDPKTRTWSVCVEELPIDTTHGRLLAWRGRLLFVSTHVEGHDALELVWIDPAAPTAAR